jgi:hypothetical protein
MLGTSCSSTGKVKSRLGLTGSEASGLGGHEEGIRRHAASVDGAGIHGCCHSLGPHRLRTAHEHLGLGLLDKFKVLHLSVDMLLTLC